MRFLLLTLVEILLFVCQVFAVLNNPTLGYHQDTNANNYPANYNTQSNSIIQAPNQMLQPPLPSATSQSMAQTSPQMAQSQSQFQSQTGLPTFPYPAEYHQALQQYANSIPNQISTGGTFAYSSPGAMAYAYSSMYPNFLKQQNDIWNQWKNNLAANPTTYNVPNYAAATAAYNQNGFHQTAAIHPPNANNPNIDTFVPASGAVNGNGNRFYGLATAAFSSSSKINGVESSRRAAYSTVNDNGKVSTYKVES